ncbi:MAG: nitroreductase/quinone reductase family protein [Solirubrobacterales bacterium]
MTATYRVEETGWARRLVRRLAATRPASWLQARTLQRTDRLVHGLTGGRATFSSWVSGLPVVMLTTTGARTGARRTLPVLGLPDGDSVVVVASNYGRPRHPAWYRNLRSNPRANVEIDRVEREVLGRELTGEERERTYTDGIAINPAWAPYRKRAQREIPVIRLEPREVSADAGVLAVEPTNLPNRTEGDAQ